MSTFRIGIDTGGTFTDLILFNLENGVVDSLKVASTPREPLHAFVGAISESGAAPAEIEGLVHGTTVATNALIERKGAHVAFVTTAGFEDMPYIQRVNRRELYNLDWDKPHPLLRSRRHCFGLHERMNARGEVVTAIDPAELDQLCTRLQGGDFEAVAVCLLFAYLNTTHEEQVREYLQARLNGMALSCSHEVAPIWREYERASTTLADAYLKPLMTRYVGDLQARLAGGGLASEWSLMKSNGGMLPASIVADNPIHTIMSGPAGGMIACKYFATLADVSQLVTLDMGGTSADVGLLVAGEQRYTTEFEVEWGVPVSVPLIDIKSIGAGGGSIGWIDAGGLLHVGPESAGANPGPICYGLGGTRPTVTDANSLLGRVAPAHFVAGSSAEAARQAHEALAQLAAPLGLSAIDGALAMVAIANANMADAIKLLTLERGLDPRDYALLAFGGAGPLHAAAIARSLGMQRVIIPPYPGMCSALGMLLADPRIDRVMTYPTTLDQVRATTLAARFEALVAAARADLAREGYSGEPQINALVSMRYLGQNYEEDIPLDLVALPGSTIEALAQAFHQHHQRRYGYHIADETIEIVALKVAVSGPVAHPSIVPALATGIAHPVEERQVYFRETGWQSCPIYRREELPVDSRLEGPAIVEEHGSTTLVEPDQRLTVTRHGMLIIELPPA